MKTKSILLISLACNIIFLITCFYIFRDKWIQKIVAMQGDAKIVMFGNSLTAQGKWVELLGRTDVLNSGFPGLCTYHFVSLLQPHVIDKHPSVCFVEAGINDITVGVSQEKIQQNYQVILETILKNGITPVVTLTLYEQNDPESKREVIQLNEFLITYCQKNKIEYLDLNQYLSDSTGLKPEFARDKTHLNTAAYEIWAEEADKVLKRMKL
ncbi:GDSL-type esterase/lipase family protein [Dyadobacter sp. LHD-138]|uniref:SGNH/GDSL hydrolase family protein n=1 Tax=Dyadobacter sp. LHD-138 TaxID=3071413 RepID=UPI0027E1D639|nr:GDSL-type esterase/lipase family protein [Dyadobacter sp. LHD-138]MDQ6478561.1 GDSL-type esterase/lipase family protein [Dyadobacter sp. LHD-138]